jgi:hypothetical protein
MCRRPDLGDGGGDRPVDGDQTAAAGRRGGAAANVRIGIAAAGAQREQQPNLSCIGLELAVGRRSQLQRPESFYSRVRLAKDAQADDPNHDEQDDRTDEGDEQLRPYTDRYPTYRPYDRIVCPAQPAPRPGK